MPSAEARIDTERPSRYLVQLCRHASAMGGAGGRQPGAHLHGMTTGREVTVQAQWSDAHGTIAFSPWGECTVTATATTLTLRVQATDAENLRRIQDVLAADLQRFGRRDQLAVNWHQPEAPSLQPGAEPTG